MHTFRSMHTFRLAFICAFAGALMACNVASLHAAPLPTNAAAMKSIVADSSIPVRWGGWRGGWGYRGVGGWGYRGWGWGAGALAGASIGGAITSSPYGYDGGPYYDGYYPGYSHYPAYYGGPYYGSWEAIQEPAAFGFNRSYRYGWRPWGYW